MVKQYIPFTTARRERLYTLGLHKRLGDCEVLLQIEYPDGTEQLKPANWNSAINAWQTKDDQRFYSKGKGGNPSILNGVPIVHVDSLNAGVPSREAAKVADREDNLDYVDKDGRPLKVIETDEHGDPAKVEYTDEEDAEPVAADGGEVELHYDLSAPEGYDGEVLDRRKAGLFDPFPVSRQEADQAVEHVRTSVHDTESAIKYVAAGALGLLGIGMLVYFFIWLLGQIGGGDGGGTSVQATLAFIALFSTISKSDLKRLLARDGNGS